MGEYNAIDWDSLRVRDPAEWAAKSQEFQMRQQELQQMGQHVGQQMAYQQEQMTQQEQGRAPATTVSGASSTDRSHSRVERRREDE